MNFTQLTSKAQKTYSTIYQYIEHKSSQITNLYPSK